MGKVLPSAEMSSVYSAAPADKTSNRMRRVYVDRNETVNHIISEGSNLVQKKNMTRHDWVGRVIKLCKGLKFE